MLDPYEITFMEIDDGKHHFSLKIFKLSIYDHL